MHYVRTGLDDPGRGRDEMLRADNDVRKSPGDLQVSFFVVPALFAMVVLTVHEGPLLNRRQHHEGKSCTKQHVVVPGRPLASISQTGTKHQAAPSTAKPDPHILIPSWRRANGMGSLTRIDPVP